MLALAAAVLATADNEELRAQLKSARYEVEALKQEREVSAVRHEKEVREARARAEADFKKAQASESGRSAASTRSEALARDLRDLQDRAANAQAELEKRARTAEGAAQGLQEELDEAGADRAASERQWAHRWQELEKKHDALQATMRDVREDLAAKTAGLDVAQERLRARDADVGTLEADVLRLRATSGDLDELATVRTQLSEQVEHIRKLEIANRDQTTELRNMRQAHRAAAVLEEEKRGLQLKLGRIDDLEKELDEAKYQRQLLEEQQNGWAVYLQGDGQDAPEFDGPEAVARALRDERLEKASLMQQLGAVRPEIVEKEGIIASLEEEKGSLQKELAKTKANGSASAGNNSTARSQARAERQKGLALKEVEYLREQLKTFDAEDDITGEVRSEAEEGLRSRVATLEDLVAQYRGELDSANTQLSTMETPPAQQQPLKRPAPADENEAPSGQVGELSRKARKLQHDLSEAQREREVLSSDNQALKTQLSALQESRRTRVLSLRSNPTDDLERYKLSSIDLLRRENRALQAQLEGRVGSRRKGDVVPAESLEEARLQVEEALAQARSKDKSIDRLKQVFNAKSLEMREAVASLLGWNIEFVPNGRFRLTSIFAAQGRHGRDKKVERHITFHGEKGTMTIAGGSDGDFGREIREQIRFWVEERNEIPGFLAACTLENLDRGKE